MNLDGLRSHIATGDIDTVVVAFTDHYGRTLGKRFDADFFLDSCAVGSGTHACDYLLTVDMEMEPVRTGTPYANWEQGLRRLSTSSPILTTLRRCRVGSRCRASSSATSIDDAAHELGCRSRPRSILRAQVAALAAACRLQCGRSGKRARVLPVPRLLS